MTASFVNLLPETFWSRVNVKTTGCWLWTPNRIYFYKDGIQKPPRQFIYPLLYGKLVGHRKIFAYCGDRRCVNPYHLFTKEFSDHIHIRSETGCWEWLGGLNKGYGLYSVNDVTVSAHRFSYNEFRGPIPDDLQLDHLCRNKKCVNPWHLDPVTANENTHRSNNLAAQNARKTHCKHGHEFTEENTLRHGPEMRWRTCLQCKRQAFQDWYNKNKDWYYEGKR